MGMYKHLDYLISYHTHTVEEYNIIVDEITNYFRTGDSNYLSEMAEYCLNLWETEMRIGGEYATHRTN